MVGGDEGHTPAHGPPCPAPAPHTQELMEGHNLQQRLQQRTRGGERVFGWHHRGRMVALDIARALHWVHRCGRGCGCSWGGAAASKGAHNGNGFCQLGLHAFRSACHVPLLPTPQLQPHPHGHQSGEREWRKGGRLRPGGSGANPAAPGLRQHNWLASSSLGAVRQPGTPENLLGPTNPQVLLTRENSAKLADLGFSK